MSRTAKPKGRGRPKGKTMIPDAAMVTFQLASAEKGDLERIAVSEGKSLSHLLRELCKAEIEGRKRQA